MSSNLTVHTGGPIGKIPYDVVREIFIHCLPRYPFDNRSQPDPTNAPMLLCHVCSSWRRDALATPILWSHLAVWIQPIIRTVFGPWALLKRQVEFIQWWQKNQGLIPPFLHLHFKFSMTVAERYQYLLAGDGMKFLLKYINSAQYLRIDHTDASVWDRILEGIRLERGVPVVWPHLRTLTTQESGKSFLLVQALIDNTPVHAPLRHLSVHSDEVPHNFAVPMRWSTLTHISLSEIQLPLTFWFSLLRAVPELQWGYFYLAQVSGEEDWPEPTQCTLHHLSTIFLSISHIDDELGDADINMFFTNLYLPNLRTLSLASYNDFWCSEYAIPDLWTVLQSTPAITMLSLRYRFLGLEQSDFSTVMLPNIEPEEPIWSHAPHLVHVQLELPKADNGRRPANPERDAEFLDNFVRNAIFSSNSWLDLNNPACPIRTITFNDASDSLQSNFDRMKDFVMSCILKYADKIPNVTFHITSEDALRLSSQMGREFGVRNIQEIHRG